MTCGKIRVALIAVAAVLGTGMAEAAFAPVPRETVKALMITRGKPFSAGVVFFNGRYLEPPYTVERYGNVIRINKVQVTGALVSWDEFLKTQKTVAVAAAEAPEAASAPEPAPEAASEPPPAPNPEASSDGEEDDPLADLFEDAPAPAPKKVTTAPAAPAEPAPVAAKRTVKLAGPFVMNDRARGLVAKMNQTRQEIDVALRCGGFFCFGTTYSRISGDKGSTRNILEKLPEVMRLNSEYAEFRSAMRDAGLVYFPDRLVKELFLNRADYLKLQKRYKQMETDARLDSILNGL